MIIAALVSLAATRQAETDFTIDANVRKPISPYIYGVNSPDYGPNPPDMQAMRGVGLAREGGNRLTAYNWETNASNAGNDWHFQNDGYLGKSDVAGWTETNFMKTAQSNGAAVLLTIPTAGYVAADKNGDGTGDVTKTPNWRETRFLKSYARKPGGHYAYPPDTTDKAVYQDEFVAYLEKTKTNSTPVFYAVDNEPDLWSQTHREIVDKPVTYAGIIANNIEFGSAIKAVAPKSLLFGPANYGWNGFRTFQSASDGNHRDFLDVYLDGMHDAEKTQGKRILDVLDIHWYPEARGDGVRITDETDKPGALAARIQAPRSLWDSTYVEDSWIASSLGKKPIALIPGIEAQIDRYYPGTRFSISEYSYGGSKVISGAIAQADALGIFGRCGLFAAANWGLSTKDTAILAGMKAFVNYDGQGAHFGDQGLAVMGGRPETSSVYAALDSKKPRRLTIVAINKTEGPMPMTFSIRGFEGASARAFTVNPGTLPQLKPTQAEVDGSKVHYRAPGLSVTVLEVGR